MFSSFEMIYNFQAGEVIILKKRVDSDWLVGLVGEKEGMFPRSFIKVKIPLPGEVCYYDFSNAMHPY